MLKLMHSKRQRRGPWETGATTSHAVKHKGRVERPIIVELSPYRLSLRVKGTRTRYSVDFSKLLQHLQQAYADSNRKKKPVRRGALSRT